MTPKNLREIKRRLRPEKCNISKIVGCFVNGNKKIVSKISQPLGLSDSVVSEKLLSCMRKTLSGSLGTSLNEIGFTTRDVTESEEHKLLMELRGTSLTDESVLERFYSKVAESLDFEGNYVILLANDVYDVPSFSKDGEESGSSETFSYVLCAVCPVKSLNDTISFKESDSLFHPMSAAAMLGNPELGFMFPTFDDRKTNIYGALYYTRGTEQNYPDFAMNVFAKEVGIPPKAQRASFCQCLSDSLGEECSYEVVKAVHERVGEMLEEAKQSKSEEPVLITKETVKDVLEGCGVAEESIAKLERDFDESFGANAELTPKNVVSSNKFELKMPEVSIKIDPEYRDYVTTREIDGEKYVLVKVTGGVEVNGIKISLNE